MLALWTLRRDRPIARQRRIAGRSRLLRRAFHSPECVRPIHSAPAPKNAGFGLLEWHTIALKDLNCSFKLRSGFFAFPFCGCDDHLRLRDHADESAPVLSISDYLAASLKLFMRVGGAACICVDQSQQRSVPSS